MKEKQDMTMNTSVKHENTAKTVIKPVVCRLGAVFVLNASPQSTARRIYDTNRDDVARKRAIGNMGPTAKGGLILPVGLGTRNMVGGVGLGEKRVTCLEMLRLAGMSWRAVMRAKMMQNAKMVASVGERFRAEMPLLSSAAVLSVNTIGMSVEEFSSLCWAETWTPERKGNRK